MSKYLDDVGLGLTFYVDIHSARVSEKCESPIEVGLLQGFVALSLLNRQFRIDGVTDWACLTDYEAKVFLQHRVDNFRCDFAVHVTGTTGGQYRSAWIAVECDGHEFHERTKEQAARDKSRDRALAAQGFRTMRFTGSEIYESCFACAAEVNQVVQSIIREWEDQ